MVLARDPFDGLDTATIRAWIEAADEVMADHRPRPPAGRQGLWERRLRAILAEVATSAEGQVGRLVRKRLVVLPVRKASEFDLTSSTWAHLQSRLNDAVTDLYREVGVDGAVAAASELGIATSFGPAGPFAADLEGLVARQVTRITETSRAAIASIVERATEEGWGADRLAAQLSESIGLWPDRAATIARTEIANAYNGAAIRTYETSGMVDKVNVYDGGGCGWLEHNDPQKANGMVVTLAEAAGNPISHPNCQRSFGPRVSGAPPRGAPGAQTVPSPQVGPRPGPTAPLETNARAAQARVFDQAERSEPEVTAALRRITEDGRSSLNGLDYRLKADGDRTVEKILGDVAATVTERGYSIEEAYAEATKVKDALRYTVVSEPGTYWANVRYVEAELRAEGMVPIKWADNWPNPLNHDLNTAWRTAEGTRFELQFHTPESLALKMDGIEAAGIRASHEIYAELRSLEAGQVAERELLTTELRDLWARTTEIPEGNYRAVLAPDVSSTRIAQVTRFRDADAAATWGDTMYAEWKAARSVTEEEAIQDYQTGAYRYINAQLRGLEPGEGLGRALTAEEVRLSVIELDRAIAAAPDTGPLTLFRGLRADAIPRDVLGQVWADPGFTSTTLTIDQARRFAGWLAEGDVPAAILRIDAASTGGTGAYLGGFLNRYEAEVLLKRGAELRFVADETVNGVRYLTAELVEAVPPATRTGELIASLDVSTAPEVLAARRELDRLDELLRGVDGGSREWDRLTIAQVDARQALARAELAARQAAIAGIRELTAAEARLVVPELRELEATVRAEMIAPYTDVFERIRLRAYLDDIVHAQRAALSRLPLEERLIGQGATGHMAVARRDLIKMTEVLERRFGLTSRWTGAVRQTRATSYAAAVEHDGTISIGQGTAFYDTGNRLKVLLHEAFHGISAGYSTGGLRVARGWEEGVAEMAAQTFEREVMTEAGLPYSAPGYNTYLKFTNALEDLRGILNMTAEDFYADLITTPLTARSSTVELWGQLLPESQKARFAASFRRATSILGG